MTYAYQIHRPGRAPRRRTKAPLPDRWRNMVRRCDSRTQVIVGLPAGMEDPEFRDRAEAEAWLAARLPDLEKALHRKMRPCLCCGTTMLSEGRHNRLCDQCRAGDPPADSY